MSDIVKIKIAKISRKELPSKFKEGETYNITTVLDENTGRKGAALGSFADNWKVGDTVESIWEKRTWKDRDGFSQESWNLKNPNAKKGGSGSWGPRKATMVDAYQIAAALVPVLFKDKTIKLDKIHTLAEEILKRLSSSTDAPKADGKDVDLNKEESSSKKKSTSAKENEDDWDEEETSKENKTEEEGDDDEDPF